jgi:hypothetical protein
MRIEPSAPRAYVKSRADHGAPRPDARPCRQLRTRIFWLYRAGLQRSGVQLPRIFSAT